ncbi:MAG: hypothetical protein J6386_04690 [Candidatus Synoicihabitans palmerolidicus]|nr:hypothetical protein [Candidatus Synoicihabitans palmerolidicus]
MEATVAHLGAAQENLTIALQQRDALRAQLTDRDTALASLQQQLNAALQSTAPSSIDQSAEVDLIAARDEISRLESLLAETRTITATPANVLPPEPKIDSATVERLTEAESKLSSSLRAFSAQERELARTRQEMRDASARADAADASITALRAQLETLQPELAAAATAAAEAEAASSAATTQVSALAEQLTAAQALADRRAEELASLQDELNVTNNSRASLTAENANLREQAPNPRPKAEP